MDSAKTKDPCVQWSHTTACPENRAGVAPGEGGCWKFTRRRGLSTGFWRWGWLRSRGLGWFPAKFHSTVVARPIGRVQAQGTPKGPPGFAAVPQSGGSEGGSQDPREAWPGGLGVRVPGPQQASRASRSSATSLGGAHRRLSTPAGLAPRPLPPRSLPARGSHRREQSAGSMRATAAPPDLPPPGSPGLSGLEDRPLPAGLPNPKPRAQAPPPPGASHSHSEQGPGAAEGPHVMRRLVV